MAELIMNIPSNTLALLKKKVYIVVIIQDRNKTISTPETQGDFNLIQQPYVGKK